MLELFVTQTSMTSPTIPVRWCVSNDTLEKLKEYKVKQPYILLTVTPKGYMDGLYRWLIPMDCPIHYIQFFKPGENKVEARIVWCNHANEWHSHGEWNCPESCLEKKFKHTDQDGVYDKRIRRILEYAQEHPDVYGSLEVAELTIVVPKEVFAKEPPDQEKRWVNLFYETAPKDQCAYRRRRIFAYSFQLFVAAPVWLSIQITRMVIAGAIAIGLLALRISPKDIGFDKFRNPWNFRFKPVFWEVKLQDTFVAKVWRRLFPLKTRSAKEEREIELQKEEAIRRQWEEQYAHLQAIVSCENRFKSVDHLPIRRSQRVHLGFQDLKSRVCKPFVR